MQVVDELHLARNEKKLEVNVMQSYGELTSMDIDPQEEQATDQYCKVYGICMYICSSVYIYCTNLNFVYYHR